MSSIAPLAPSIELTRRVAAAAAAYTIARLRVLERIPGNPVGVAIQKFGEATALSAQSLSSSSFNGVVGLRAGQAQLIQPLVEWQRQRGSPGRFELSPGDYDCAMGRELARLGFFQSGFHAALVGEPGGGASPPAAIAVDRVASAADMEDFLAAYVAGWGIADEWREQFKANVRAWRGEPGWSLYVARIDGRPAAAAILFVHAGVGYFADSATNPAFRQRGLHAALLARRQRDAKAAAVDLVCGGADFLSTSHRNMERAGLRLSFLRAIWTPLEP